MISRLTDIDKAPTKSFLSNIGIESLPTIQFSKLSYTKTTLKSINALCKVFGKKLPIRFYGHYNNDFDAAILKHLPDVQWLLIDCLQEISNPEYIFQLSKLKKLSFGVYDYKNPNFLSQLDIENLESLSLSETKGRDIDLTQLGKAQAMQELFVQGHTKGIFEISKMNALKSLTLSSISKKTRLEFVSSIADLKTFRLILGGRENINEISHSKLNELEVIRVRGLSNLGDLSRFPHLERLQIEDQIQIQLLELNATKLKEIKIINCKSLRQLEHLDLMKNLEQMRCYRTSLDYEHLASREWPETLKTLALYTGKSKRDEAIRKQLDLRGYKEF